MIRWSLTRCHERAKSIITNPYASAAAAAGGCVTLSAVPRTGYINGAVVFLACVGGCAPRLWSEILLLVVAETRHTIALQTACN